MTVTDQHQVEINGAVARLAAINAQIAELAVQAGALKTFIRLALGAGTHAAGKLRVSIIPRKTFDPALAAQVLTPDVLTLVTVTESRIDSKLAKDVLPPSTYEACCRMTEPQVRIA